MSRWLIACGTYPTGTSGEPVTKDKNNTTGTIPSHPKQKGVVIQDDKGFEKDVERELGGSPNYTIEPLVDAETTI